MKNLIRTAIVGLSISLSLIAQAQTNEQSLEPFYKHLGSHIKFPNELRDQKLEGSSLITFQIVKGKLSSIKVERPLGYGADTEVLKQLVDFNDFQVFKDGSYALRTNFQLQGIQADRVNPSIATPPKHQLLNLVIVGFAAKDAKAGITDVKSLMELRGNLNFEEGKKPLIILDQKEIAYEDFKTIDPNNIESFQIIKDAAAVGVYGAKSANGVFLITSKNADAKTAVEKIVPLKGQVNGLEITIKNDKQPLFILDGEAITKQQLDDVDPNTIESIDVLKDAASTAMFGPAGINGVIKITSKSAKEKSKN